MAAVCVHNRLHFGIAGGTWSWLEHTLATAFLPCVATELPLLLQQPTNLCATFSSVYFNEQIPIVQERKPFVLCTPTHNGLFLIKL